MNFRRSSNARSALVATAATALGLLFAAAPASAKIDYGLAPQTPLGVADYQKMQSIKTDVIKNGVGWGDVQQNAGDCTALGGACNWAAADAQIGAAAANGGIRSVFTLIGSAPFVNPNPLNPPTNDIDAWKDFTGAWAERYGPGGAYWTGPYQAQFGAGAPVVPVTEVQIWNEPSSFQFFKPKPNVKKYAKILTAASDAVKGANKKVDIVLGGMFPDTGPKGIKIEKFLSQLYDAQGVKDKTFDAIAIHPYAENGKALLKQIGSARKTMNKSGGKKDDIWVTEIGYASDGPNEPVVKKGEKGQAKAIDEAYKAMKKKAKKYDIVGIIYFTWQDVNRAVSAVCKFCQFAGLLDNGGAEKQAFKTYKKVAK